MSKMLKLRPNYGFILVGLGKSKDIFIFIGIYSFLRYSPILVNRYIIKKYSILEDVRFILKNGYIKLSIGNQVIFFTKHKIFVEKLKHFKNKKIIVVISFLLASILIIAQNVTIIEIDSVASKNQFSHQYIERVIPEQKLQYVPTVPISRSKIILQSQSFQKQTSLKPVNVTGRISPLMFQKYCHYLNSRSFIMDYQLAQYREARKLGNLKPFFPRVIQDKGVLKPIPRSQTSSLSKLRKLEVLKRRDSIRFDLQLYKDGPQTDGFIRRVKKEVYEHLVPLIQEFNQLKLERRLEIEKKFQENNSKLHEVTFAEQVKHFNRLDEIETKIRPWLIFMDDFNAVLENTNYKNQSFNFRTFGYQKTTFGIEKITTNYYQ